MTRLSAVSDCTDDQRGPVERHRLHDPARGLEHRAGQPDGPVQDLEQEPRVVACGRGGERALLLEHGTEREQHGSEDGQGLTHGDQVSEIPPGERGCGVTCSMRGKELLSRRAASNLAAAKMDLAAATADGDADRVTLLRDARCPAAARSWSTDRSCSTTPCCSATSRRREHVAVVVPGVGDGTNLCDDWIPEAREPLRGRRLDGRRPVEGLRQPGRRPGRGRRVDRVQRGPGDRRPRPDRVRRLPRPGARAVVDRGGPQLRVDRHRGRAGRRRAAWSPTSSWRAARA